MRKTLLIIRREYLSRVKKKSFLLMTILVPLLFMGMTGLVAYLTHTGGDAITEVAVIDKSGFFLPQLKNSKSLIFLPTAEEFSDAKLRAREDGSFVLFIPKDIGDQSQVQLVSEKKAPMFITNEIENQINNILRTKHLQEAGIDIATLERIKPNVSIEYKELTDEGEKKTDTKAAYAISFAAAILIYICLFIYGAQVMRGVIEEKTSRIVEVIISSVKPFQLMLGKIIGIGMVGLTQFLLWVTLSYLATKITDVQALPMLSALQTIPVGYILVTFLAYFLGGYLLYSALFAAVGSAVDNETETQQFMFPITLPLLFTYIMAFSFIVNNPNSTLSFWLSMIPFTSPIAMMVRIPFGVPDWQLYLSITFLIAGFIFTTWVAARIYRVGILMYGKKSSYRELLKWFLYKE
ncbi:ABC transporter permease [Paradesertivirga mongoliensis]|uniref:ABC transporter permease n=1 Tax=Paradesertivirga mongoliensis TaxID=2100740 RepID=A0ABW4ZPJ8_9SPHI|nr:ABC transporter permease [Pedobacter mongoliensis]